MQHSPLRFDDDPDLLLFAKFSNNFAAEVHSSLFSVDLAATLGLNIKFNRKAATMDSKTRETFIVLTYNFHESFTTLNNSLHFV